MPNATSTLSGISEWFNPFWAEFWSWGLLAIGVILAFGLISWLVRLFGSALHKH